ncbi:MAG: PAS domain S-box protein [Thermodesulfobacteriota bacterium]
MFSPRLLASAWLALAILAGTAAPPLAAQPVKVGVYNFTPLIFMDNGSPAGLFVDILKDVAKREDWQLEFIFGSWAECLARLDSGEIDILPSIAQTEERSLKFDFSREYLFLDWGLIYRRKGSRLNTVFDLDGKRVAALEGSVYTKEFQSLAGQFDIAFTLVPVREYAEGMELLSRGLVDVAVCTNVFGTLLEDRHDVERTSIVFAPIKIRFAVRKGRYGELLAPLDAAVEAMKLDKGSLYFASYDKWMGFNARRGIPPWVWWTVFGLVGGLGALGVSALALRRLVKVRTRELENALASLGDSERRFRSAFEQAAVGMAHVAPDGRWLLVNGKLCDMLGYTRAELLSTGYQEITHPGDLGKDLECRRLLLAGDIPMFTMEKRYIRKDGGLVWVDISVSLARDLKGEPLHCISVIQDISERKRVEGELEKARGYIRNIINSMPSVVIGVDASSRVTHFNQTAATMLDMPGQAAVGRSLERVFPDYAAQLSHIRQAIEERKPVLLERQPRTTGGELRYQDILIYPLVSNGVEGAVLRIDDVTERVRLTEMMVQTEKMMSVGGLAAGMAHEINNPLGAILQSAQVIKTHVDPASPVNEKTALECGCTMEAITAYLEKRKVIAFIEAIRESGVRAARIVANMLDFSRRDETRLEPTSVRDILDRSLELASSDYDLKKKYDFKHIVIVKDYAGDLPPVICSRTEIEQVVLNILKNAAQAMADKSYGDERPTITLRAARAGSMVSMVIEDNGPGMEPAVCKRVFEPFFTTKEPGQGTGLGLSVSYFIITNNHGGTISVDSEPGKGARFTIRLPAAGFREGA